MRTPADRLTGILRSGIIWLTVFTFVVDILLFVQPVYMLQVYDRVLVSGSIDTLLYISLMAVAALLLLGAIDTLRGMLASRIAAQLDTEIGADAMVASLRGPQAALGDVQPLRDLGTIRGFISNRGIMAFLDIPFAPVFIGMLYFVHPHLFFITLGGAVLLALVALANQVAIARTIEGPEASNGMRAMMAAQSFARSAETIHAMGMVSNVTNAWGRSEALSLAAQETVNARNAMFSGLARLLRLGLQIAILGYGGYLVVEGQMTAGMIFASSIISGRGLQPIDQVIAGWKGFVETRKAWTRLNNALLRHASRPEQTELPTPRGALTLDQVVVFSPNAGPGAEPLLRRVSAHIRPGECVAVIGASGAGKSMLARTLVGALPAHSGSVRLDGADIRAWRPEQFGRHVGYLSQEVDLLPGTVKENIARFDADATDEAVIEAATKAQVHELILSLSAGYDTVIGPTGQQLSGGQRQRIALARAFFGNPCVLVLDEPNANLDAQGDVALERAVAGAKAEGVTIVFVTQRRQIAELADKLMVIRDGMIEDFAPRREVLERQTQRLRVVNDGQNKEVAATQKRGLAGPNASAGASAAAAAPA